MTAAIIARSVRILRAQSLLAEALAWEAHYDYEADRLWARSEQVAKAEVRPC